MYPSLTRYPGDLAAGFDALTRTMDQLFGPSGLPSSIRASGRGAFPALNMGTTQEALEIYAFAPGIDASRLEVSVDKGLLTIAGERGAETPQAEEGANVYANERFAGSFRRVVSLPEEVDASRVEASYRDGVLRIVVPKREQSKPRRVAITQ
jgi:HSP20 family protein